MPEQYEKLRVHLRSFPDEAVATVNYEDAARSSSECRAKGIAVFAVDILLCAVAASGRWSIFTTDPDFTMYREGIPV